MDRSRSSKVRPGGALLLLALVAGGCGPSGAGTPGELSAPGAGSRSAPVPSDASLWMSFDRETGGHQSPPEYPDSFGGPFTGTVLSGNGGRVESVGGAPGRGLGVAFPPRCDAPSGCPRALVEVVPDAELDPGEAAFAYGATVLLATDQTTAGSNIVQQGRFGTTGGQWKLQVDGDAGNPSCVLRWGTDVLTVRSGSSVADGSWHHVVCRRDRSGLSIAVDGTLDRVAGRSGSVSNRWPIRIGSPGVGDQDDQFHGRLDDVFLQIEPGA